MDDLDIFRKADALERTLGPAPSKKHELLLRMLKKLPEEAWRENSGDISERQLKLLEGARRLRKNIDKTQKIYPTEHSIIGNIESGMKKLKKKMPNLSEAEIANTLDTKSSPRFRGLMKLFDKFPTGEGPVYRETLEKLRDLKKYGKFLPGLGTAVGIGSALTSGDVGAMVPGLESEPLGGDLPPEIEEERKRYNKLYKLLNSEK